MTYTLPEKLEPYRVEPSPEGYDETYDVLVGPNGFECVLTEPEDRTWGRDGKKVVDELNRLASSLTPSREQEGLREALERTLSVATKIDEWSVAWCPSGCTCAESAKPLFEELSKTIGKARAALASPSREGEGLARKMTDGDFNDLRELLDAWKDDEDLAGYAQTLSEMFNPQPMKLLRMDLETLELTPIEDASPLPSAGVDDAVEALRLHFHKYCNSYLEERSEPGNCLVRRWSQDQFKEEARSILHKINR